MATSLLQRSRDLRARPSGAPFRIPVSGVRAEDIADTYQAPRSGGRQHAGIDIFADRGTPVVASIGGRVLKAANDGGNGGNRVWVQGDDGRAYYYAHLDRLNVAEGQEVTIGQPLGTVGNTGNAQGTSPHLHFSINHRMGAENPVGNPMSLIRRASSVDPSEAVVRGPSGSHPAASPSETQRGPTDTHPAAPGSISSGGRFGLGPGGSPTPGTSQTFTDPFAEAPEPPESDAEVEEFIRNNHGHLSWALDHSEVGPILKQAAREMWSAGRLQGALFETNWWQKTAAAERSWTVLEEQDPAEAGRQIEVQVSSFRQQLRNLGIPIHGPELRSMARDSLRFDWNEAEQRSAINGYAGRRGMPRTLDNEGEIARVMGDLQALSRGDYFLPMSDRSAWTHARRIIEETETPESVRDSLRRQAASRFPDFSDRIQAGETPREVFDPYIETAAELLEMDPDAIDPIDDHRFSDLTEHIDDDGNRRAMTLAEWNRHLRKLPEYRFTGQANRQAATVANDLTRIFGSSVFGSRLTNTGGNN